MPFPFMPRPFPHPHHQAGFTLLEMSVVLTIIGLIVGGVIVASDLIRSAQVQAVIDDGDRYKKAIQPFEEKYKHLPGNMPSLSTNNLGMMVFGAICKKPLNEAPRYGIGEILWHMPAAYSPELEQASLLATCARTRAKYFSKPCSAIVAAIRRSEELLRRWRLAEAPLLESYIMIKC